MTAVDRECVGRAAEAIRIARRSCPSYGTGQRPLERRELGTVCGAHRMSVHVRALDVPSLLLPAVVGGGWRLLVDEHVDRSTRDLYLVRHELGHVLAGDADELTTFSVNYPLPPAEMVADLFAFSDLLTDIDLDQGSEWLGGRLRSLVALEHSAWYLRVERIVRLLPLLSDTLSRGRPNAGRTRRREFRAQA